MSTFKADRPIRSLTWDGNNLVDWVGGGTRYRLDGSIVKQANVNYAYAFDSAVVSPSGQFSVIYQNFGTKGLVLKGQQILREINRSFYHANVYNYPITLFALPDGRQVIAHCPDHYNRLEIDDLESGERLTASSDREPSDFFHSNLSANDGGTRLISAGWVWHPWNAVVFYDVQAALRDPRTLDTLDFSPETGRNVCLAEETQAAFQDDDRVLIASSDEEDVPDEDDVLPDPRLLPRSIACFDLNERRYMWNTKLESCAGVMMPLGNDRVVDFFNHPKMIDLNSGRILQAWKDLPTGKRTGCISVGAGPLPTLAIDRQNKRFAVAIDQDVTVVLLS